MHEQDEDLPMQGTAEFKTVKAGCGIRFDPEQLDEESGFDFSDAKELVNATEESDIKKRKDE